MTDRLAEEAEAVGVRAQAKGLRVGAAESLTSGRLAVELGRAERASEWFAGSVVAYSVTTKNRLLGVPVGPVVSAECAEQMVQGILDAGIADVAVSVTGVGGPDAEEGQPPGTVFIGAGSAAGVRTYAHRFPGAPAEVVEATTLAALKHLNGALLEA